MIRLLESEEKELDVLDAGTTMRFLSAYCALTGKEKILTGTPRMCQRPVLILVDALKELGAEVRYLNNEGFPPLETKGFKKQTTDKISMRGDVSSQYISAILMLAPVLEHGLTLHLDGNISSRPYIEMTLQLMNKFGAKAGFVSEDTIQVDPTPYTPTEFAIEADWSGASYWLSFVAVAEKAEVVLKGLKSDSLQGDIRILDMMDPLGVKSEFIPGGLKLSKKESVDSLHLDFSQCPDMAQTVAVTCALKGIKCSMEGLESLRIKETDRITALQNELTRIGAGLEEPEKGQWMLMPSERKSMPSEMVFDTYDDHRMAMAFAPVACLTNVIIKEPAVVRKSYPGFWEDMKKAGFKVS
jgi:3-phosphoshikimate 1-carboxyvinyltransferase